MQHIVECFISSLAQMVEKKITIPYNFGLT